MKSHIKDRVNLLVTCDVLAIVVSFVVAFALGHRGALTYMFGLQYCVGIITQVVLVFVLLFVFDAYSLNRASHSFLRTSLMIGLSLFLGAVGSTFTFFFLRNQVPRAVFIIFYISAFILIILMRYLMHRKALRSNLHVLVVGGGDKCDELYRLIQNRPHLSIEIVGFLSDMQDVPDPPGSRRLGKVSDLLFVVEEQDVDTVIVATRSPISKRLASDLVDCMQRKLSVATFTHIVEQITGKIPVTYLTDNWFILELCNRDKRYYWFCKRIADICIAICGMLLTLPFLLLAALAIKLDSAGPVFYRQERIGRDNQRFSVWKLRTMIDGADRNSVHWTLDNDKRITRVGKILRKLRFDEVPQFINILKGDMSLIGPRPEAVSLVETYMREIPFYLERHMVSPGITGWAQISYRYGNSIEDTLEKLMYDFYYIKNRCAVLDIMILLRTVRTVLTGKGAM